MKTITLTTTAPDDNEYKCDIIPCEIIPGQSEPDELRLTIQQPGQVITAEDPPTWFQEIRDGIQKRLFNKVGIGGYVALRIVYSIGKIEIYGRGFGTNKEKLLATYPLSYDRKTIKLSYDRKTAENQ